MKNAQNITFICLYTLLFTGLIFIGKEILFPSLIEEEQFLEPTIGQYFSDFNDNEFSSFSGSNQADVDAVIHELIYESFKEKYTQDQKEKVFLRYVPTSFVGDIEYSYVPLVEVFLYKKDILSHINNLGVFLYKNRNATRGRMKGGNIHLYGIEKMSDSEFLSVLIHEFGHYYDIYSLPGTSFGDTSQDFYNISWNSPTIMKQGSDVSDFVSGYGMTNQYEDFAETYVYYILHNEDFIYKSLSNTVLAKKYNYIREYIFQTNQFLQEDFSADTVQEYYWDITKLNVDVKKFLQYIGEAI